MEIAILDYRICPIWNVWSSIFFLLSGYLIFTSLSHKGSLLTFYKRRAVRIVPIYYIVVLVNFIVFEVIFRSVPDDTIGLGWFRYIFFLNTSIPANSKEYWNNLSAFWSIPTFIFFYAIAPLLFKGSKNVKAAFAETAVLVGINIVCINIPEIIRGYGEYAESIQYLSSTTPLSVLWIFLIGGCVWRAKDNKTYLCIPFVVGIIGLIYGIGRFTLVAIFALLIYFCADIKPVLGKTTTLIIRIIDEYSFSTYLGHTTVLNVVSYLRNLYRLSTFYVIVFSGLGTVVLVVLLHNLIEKLVEKVLKC